MEYATKANTSDRSPQVMLAGDSRDLPEIRLILAHLPNDSYGQVFLEVASPLQVVPLAAPSSVAITWLKRDAHRGTELATVEAARGDAVAAAVLGWASEWLEPGCHCGPTSFYVWVGCELSPTVGRAQSLVRTMLEGISQASANHSHG